jgi:hypothetical protein
LADLRGRLFEHLQRMTWSFVAVMQTFMGIAPALVCLVAGFLIAAGAWRSVFCRRGCCFPR